MCNHSEFKVPPLHHRPQWYHQNSWDQEVQSCQCSFFLDLYNRRAKPVITNIIPLNKMNDNCDYEKQTIEESVEKLGKERPINGFHVKYPISSYYYIMQTIFGK